MIFEFAGFDEPVTAMIQSSVIDIVAIVLKSGRVICMNVKTGDIVMDISHNEQITSLSFRKGIHKT
jgi:hypothetical protein